MASLLKNIFRWIGRIVFLLVLLVAIILGVFSQSKTLRMKLMKIGLKHMSRDKNVSKKVEYCELFSHNIEGVVVDLGCGGGGLLNCWSSDIPVKKYIGVDPNFYAHGMVEDKIQERNLTFDYEIKRDIQEVETKSIDFVLTSLTMCSIDDLQHIFENVDRILKPGGKFIYFEHVVDRKTFGIRRLVQFVLYPFLRILGDGCNMQKDTGRTINEYFFRLPQGLWYEEKLSKYSVVDWMPYIARSVLRGIIVKKKSIV